MSKGIKGGSANPVAIFNSKGRAIDNEYPLEVELQDVTNEPMDLYLIRIDATASFTAAPEVGDTVFAVNSVTNMSVGDAINVFDDNLFYQGLITDITELNVTVSPPVDKEFTANAFIEVGPWNMCVDGSETPQTFQVHPPPLMQFDIYTLTFSGQGAEGVSMDTSTFLSISDNLPNGLIIRRMNDETKNIGLFVNNLGFAEFGYDLTFYGANKKSFYGMLAKKNKPVINGAAVRIGPSDAIQVIIQDDLTTETQFSCVVHGHVVVE